MKNEILTKLSEIVNGLDGHNYQEGFSRIKDLLGQLRGIMDPTTLDEVCEVFGDDYTVRGILTKYFNSGETSLINGLESYLSSSVSALDSEIEDSPEDMYSSFTTELPNIVNTEEIENMNKEASIKDVEVTDGGMVKALVELPVADAAKVLTAVAHEESLGGTVADELAKVIIEGDPKVGLADSLKPIEGKVIQIIDTRSDIKPESFSVSKIRSYNKYMYMFSEAVDPVVEELASEECCTEEECGLEAALEAPEEIPVKSTVVETNSALPTVEAVGEATQPIGYVDSEMVQPGENEAVDALGEISSALGGLEAEQASEALGLIAEKIGPEAAESIQGEVLAKHNPELFSSFSKNSWITDQEVFAAYNVLSNYFSGQITNFSTESGSALKDRFLSNFASAVELVNNSFYGTMVRRARAAEAKGLFEEVMKKSNKQSHDFFFWHKTADDKAKLINDLKLEKKAIEDALKKGTGNKNKKDLIAVNEKLQRAREDFDVALNRFEEIAKNANSNIPVTEVSAKAGGLMDAISEHPIKSGLLGAGTILAGGLGGAAIANANKPVAGLDDFEGFSKKMEENGYYFSESSEVMEEVVEKVSSPEVIEGSAELLAEVAEKVSPEVALAIQAEMCKENSNAAKEVADNAIVSEEEVVEALGVINDVLENGTQESFSQAKNVYFQELMANFADIAKDMAESDDEEDDEKEDEKEKGELVNLEEGDISKESPEMDEVIKKFESLPAVEDAATLLVEIEDKVGPEAALAVQSELLKENSDFFKEINEQIVMDDDVVKEIYSVVNGFNPDAEMNFSEKDMDRYSVYVRNFAEALSDKEKAAIVEEVKNQVMTEMSAPVHAPEELPVHPVAPEGTPELAPEQAPIVPPAPAVPVDVHPAPEAIPAPAPIPAEPTPAEAPMMPPPGMAAAPQAPVSVEYPGQFIPPTGVAPIDAASVERPDIAPVVPGLISEPITPPAPFATEAGVADVPPLPMEMPTEAVATSTTGNFTPSAVNAPKYVHMIPQNPIEQMQATMPPVEPAVGNPQLPPATQLSDVEVQKAIVDNFSRARKQVSFSSTKKSDIEEYTRIMSGM